MKTKHPIISPPLKIIVYEVTAISENKNNVIKQDTNEKLKIKVLSLT